MRTALVSLIALASVATAAVAQEQAPPAAPMPESGAPAAPDSAATPTNPAPTVAQPAAPEPPAPPPQRPTTGDGAEVLSIIERVCVPLVRGGNFDQIARGAGLKKDRKSGGYVAAFTSGKAYGVTILPPGANPNVCQMELRYAIDQSEPILKALNIWTILHQPELKPQRRDYKVDSDYKRTTTSWEHYTATESIGLVFVELRRPDGGALNGKFDSATLQYSERKF